MENNEQNAQIPICDINFVIEWVRNMFWGAVVRGLVAWPCEQVAGTVNTLSGGVSKLQSVKVYRTGPGYCPMTISK